VDPDETQLDPSFATELSLINAHWEEFAHLQQQQGITFSAQAVQQPQQQQPISLQLCSSPTFQQQQPQLQQQQQPQPQQQQQP
jgi:hypothetical protein